MTNFEEEIKNSGWGKIDEIRVQWALEFAQKAHEGAYRKGTNIPYIEHPVEAAAIVMTMTSDADVVIGALLHDVAEDTEFSIEDIETLFGSRIAELVGYETENKREDQKPEDTWRIRKQETLDHLEHVPYEAKIITLGDKLSNLRAIDKNYSEIGDKLWDRFNQKDPQAHGWYYKSIRDLTKEFSEKAAWQEYDALCTKVFG